MIKVCQISTVHPLGDPRIFHKQCKSLVKGGFDVTLIIQHTKNEVLDGIKIIGLPITKNRFGRFFLGFKAFRLGLKTKAKIIHFHDPELIWTGVWFRIFGKKVIFDVHEDVAKQILDKTWIGPRWFRKFVSWSYKANEKICCLFFSGIIAATDDILNKFPLSKSISIHNYPDLDLLVNKKEILVEKTKPAIVYAGALTSIRGIFELIEAVGELNGNVELWLLGKWESDEFKKKCEQSIGYEFTKYFGSKQLDEVYGYYAKADIGISVLHPIERYLTAIPTKIVECMSLGLPTIMTGSDYLKKYFEGNAVFVDNYTVKGIAESIESLVNDKDQAQRLSIDAKKMIVNKMSWQVETPRLLAFYSTLAKA